MVVGCCGLGGYGMLRAFFFVVGILCGRVSCMETGGHPVIPPEPKRLTATELEHFKRDEIYPYIRGFLRGLELGAVTDED